MGEAIVKALLNDNQKIAPANQVARHLARVALFELTGTDALYPDLKDAYTQLCIAMANKGMPVYLSEGFRTAKRQADVYASGRTNPGSIVTKAEPLQSMHQYCLAMDIIFKDYNWNPPSKEWWDTLGAEGKKLGLEWGGNWTFKDLPHFELPGYQWQDFILYFKS